MLNLRYFPYDEGGRILSSSNVVANEHLATPSRSSFPASPGKEQLAPRAGWSAAFSLAAPQGYRTSTSITHLRMRPSEVLFWNTTLSWPW
jgi:hypothetical protein